MTYLPHSMRSTGAILLIVALLVVVIGMASCTKNEDQMTNLIEKNKADGEAYLKTNGQRPEVTTLASGVQYEILKAGDGLIPKLTDKVKCHYHGMLINGHVFDSSVDRGEPATFPVNGVILGWQEVLQMMPVGSKWRVVIPAKLAYGARGAGRVIPPYSTLIFDIELLGIM